MKIDVVSIFPDYLEPLRLSLVGQGNRDRHRRPSGPRSSRLDPLIGTGPSTTRPTAEAQAW